MATDEIILWYRNQYKNSVGINQLSGTLQFKRLTDSFPVFSESFNGFPLSSRMRIMEGFIRLKTRYPLNPEGYYTIMLSATIGDIQTQYGYGYWRTGDEDNVIPEYICAGPTYESKDGEYRNGVLLFNAFNKFYEKNIDRLNPFEEAVLNLLSSGELTLDIQVFPNKTDIINKLTNHANNLRLPITILTYVLSQNLKKVNNGAIMFHTSKSFVSLVKLFTERFPALLECETIKIIDGGSFCGQKIVPMYTKELTNPNDYNLPTWRELQFMQLISDLVINFITPAFPIYNQWTYIENTDESIYSNVAMKERYTRSQVADISTQSLRTAREIISSIAPNSASESYSSSIYDTIEYAQGYLLISDVTMLHTMEHVGITIDSFANLTSKNKLLMIFDDKELSAKCIFDMVFGLHCLQTKINVMHSDLHSNNMTIKLDNPIEIPPYDDPIAMYVTDTDESDAYIFNKQYYNSYIIDFSRVIAGPDFRPHLEKDKDSHYADNFYRDQVNRVMRTLHRYSPGYVAANQEAIKSAIISRFDMVFPVLCAVDYIAVGSNIAATMKRDSGKYEGFDVCPEIYVILQEIEDAGREMLTIGLRGIVAFIAGTAVPKFEFPGTTVIRRAFSEWRYPKWVIKNASRLASVQLVDAFNYNNEYKYHGENYSDFPPWARFDEIEKHLGNHKMTDLIERGLDPFMNSMKPSILVDIISEKQRAMSEKLDGARVHVDSSWID